MSDNTNEIILEVKDLKKSFGDHVVLESINTTVRKGEVIAIIGPSGCGKSTFLRSTFLKLLQKVMYYSMSRILQIRV
jgi:polar amino acid transport system ATP-binding protein